MMDKINQNKNEMTIEQDKIEIRKIGPQEQNKRR